MKHKQTVRNNQMFEEMLEITSRLAELRQICEVTVWVSATVFVTSVVNIVVLLVVK